MEFFQGPIGFPGLTGLKGYPGLDGAPGLVGLTGLPGKPGRQVSHNQTFISQYYSNGQVIHETNG